MNRLQGIASAALKLAVAVAVGAGAWWLVTNKPAASKPDKPPAPATVTKVVKEDELLTVTLSEDAEKRIGLTVGAVAKKSVRRVRVYGGEVMVPVGHAILVAAPLGGTLKPPAGGEPKVGQVVKAGQPVCELTPLLTPDGRATLSAALADAEGQVNNAKAQVDAAVIALDRSKRVLKEGVGSQRLVDESQAAFELVTKTFDAAKSRQAILKKVVGDAETGTVAPIVLAAPTSGILRAVSALPGQTVPPGAALFEVVDLSAVWVRVALPVGDLDTIDRTEPAQMGKLSSAPGARLVHARPVQAPPSANPVAATVDVYYTVPNADGAFTPGQRLGATLALTGAADGPTVPWSAVVFDVNGGTWVYERTGTRQFARRRVAVSHTVGTDAALTSGPPVGAPVVTAGVQELFGAETGFVK